jgi:hypothetical protein
MCAPRHAYTMTPGRHDKLVPRHGRAAGDAEEQDWIESERRVTTEAEQTEIAALEAWEDGRGDYD